MSLPEKIANLFVIEPKIVAVTENFGLAEWRIEGRPNEVPTASVLNQHVGGLPPRDKLTVTVSVNDEPVTFRSDQPDSAEGLIAQCKVQFKVADPLTVVTVTVSISKNLSGAAVSLYSLSAFKQTIKTKVFRERLKIFEPATCAPQKVWVQLFEDLPAFWTESLYFSSRDPHQPVMLRREELRIRRNELCHSEFAAISFTPEDFYLVTRSSDSELNALLDGLCAATSLLFIADISEAAPKQNQIAFRLNGYKVITGKLNLEPVDPETAQAWYQIYQWAYSGGGVSDKLGLARNIMSLHWKGNASDLVEPSVLTSIRSGYEIYLKQNVKQYIEVKGKLNDYLTDYTAKATKLSEGLAEKFEKNVTAFVSFFITSILAKVLTDKSFSGVFNRPVAIIGVLIVVGSVLHLCLSVYVFNKDRDRLEGDWDILRRRYSDLLDEADLQRIFDKSNGFNQAQEHVARKKTLFVGVWVTLLVIALGLILALADWSIPNSGSAASSNANRTNSVQTGAALPGPQSTNASPLFPTNTKTP